MYIRLQMLIPENKEIFEGEIATYWFDDGILVSLSKSPKRTVANLTANITLVKKISNNKKVPLLIFLSNSPMPDKDARKFATEQLPHVYTAMAMVSKAKLAQFIMSVLFKFNKPPIPMKNFSNYEEAKQWLQQYK